MSTCFLNDIASPYIYSFCLMHSLHDSLPISARFQQIEDRDAVGDACRMLADQDETTLFGNALGIGHADIEPQGVAQIFERLETGEVCNVIGKFDRPAIPQQGVEEGPHGGPQRMPDDALAAFGDQHSDAIKTGRAWWRARLGQDG